MIMQSHNAQFHTLMVSVRLHILQLMIMHRIDPSSRNAETCIVAIDTPKRDELSKTGCLIVSYFDSSCSQCRNYVDSYC